MKRFVIGAVALGTMIAATGCGNMAVIDPGNFTFNHMRTDTENNEPMCLTVEKWWDNESGIEVMTAECGPMYFSEGDYILINDAENCPYCRGME
jgi:hypothetical protein